MYFFDCHKSHGILSEFLTLEVRSKRAYRLKYFCTNLNRFELVAVVLKIFSHAFVIVLVGGFVK